MFLPFAKELILGRDNQKLYVVSVGHSSGEFILYPSKPNTNIMKGVYNK